MFVSWTTVKMIAVTVSLHLMTTTAWAESNQNSNQHRDEQRALLEAEKARAREQQTRASAEERLRKLDDRLRAMQDEARMLRMQQVDLQAELERAAIDDDSERAGQLQRAMIEIEHQLQRRQLELERVHLDRDRSMEQRELMRMSDRFEYVANWQGVAFEPPSAVMMATQAIVELHIANGHPEKAAKRLESLLKKLTATGPRTAIRFALKDIYTELGELDKSEHHMIKIILENAGSLESEEME